MAPKYIAKIAQSAEDLRACQALRAEVFRAGRSDEDRFDPHCTHILITERHSARPVCGFRMQSFESGRRIDDSYAAQFYNLERLHPYQGKLLEIGRFCLDPQANDPDILRLAWAMMAAYVEANRIEFIFGCSSFAGASPSAHLPAFAQLKAGHLAPRQYAPQIKAPEVIRFDTIEPDICPDHSPLPPLLRSYLLMGAWVSDHAVLDKDLNTQHVFTGLEISAMPESRKRLLVASGRSITDFG